MSDNGVSVTRNGVGDYTVTFPTGHKVVLRNGKCNVEREGKMSDLKERADELANDLCVNHGLDAHDAIRDAILLGMVEALEAEPDVEEHRWGVWALKGAADEPEWGQAEIVRSAMAEARVKQIKEGK